MPRNQPGVQNNNNKITNFVLCMIKKYFEMENDIRYYEELNSTNETMIHLLNSNELAEGTVVQAGSQSGGKGHG